jgi:hypothetical protein
MSRVNLGDEDFIRLFKEVGPHELARRTGFSVRRIYARRKQIEAKTGEEIVAPNPRGRPTPVLYPHRFLLDVENGEVVVGGDFHYWPGPASTAHRAFVKLIRDIRPAAVILNGDVIDATTISRHPPIGWEQQPSLVDEIEAAQERVGEIESACPRKTKRVWTLGNHDARFETRLATVAPQYAKIHGVHLKDHFPAWHPAWSVWINDDVVVKHRFKGGIHAPHNNTIWAGKSIITNHLHSQKVIPFTDYNGTRYGVDTGCVANPDAKAFLDYSEDNPKNWRSGFVILTFREGRLMLPELVSVWDEGRVQFRGQLIDV